MQKTPTWAIPLIRWLFFTVGVALLPLALVYFVQAMFRQNPTIMGVIQHGELYLVATGLAATAMGELMSKMNGQMNIGVAMFAGFLGFLVVFFSTAFFTALQLFTTLQPQFQAMAQAMQKAQPNNATVASMILSINESLLLHTSWIACAVAVVIGIYASCNQEPAPAKNPAATEPKTKS